MNTLILRALDTLFFRGGAPFTMGQDNEVDSFFPPLPSTLYGAIATALYPDIEDLRVKLIALKGKGQMFFPLPKDLIIPELQKKGEYKTEALELVDNDFISNRSSPKILLRKKDSNKSDKVVDEDALITHRQLQKYLDGTKKEGHLVEILAEMLTKEHKVGIARNNESNIVTDGMLYKTSFVRPENKDEARLDILVQYSNTKKVDTDFLKLGGEGKIVALEEDRVPNITCPELDSNIFKLYLATPAIFTEGGYFPEKILQKYDLELLAASVGKCVNIGGWDVSNKAPKPMLKAVPAGTVYYLKAKSITAANKFAELVHGSSISDYNYDSKLSLGRKSNTDIILNSAYQGFGIVYIGKKG